MQDFAGLRVRPRSRLRPQCQRPRQGRPGSPTFAEAFQNARVLQHGRRVGPCLDSLAIAPGRFRGVVPAQSQEGMQDARFRQEFGIGALRGGQVAERGSAGRFALAPFAQPIQGLRQTERVARQFQGIGGLACPPPGQRFAQVGHGVRRPVVGQQQQAQIPQGRSRRRMSGSEFQFLAPHRLAVQLLEIPLPFRGQRWCFRLQGADGQDGRHAPASQGRCRLPGANPLPHGAADSIPAGMFRSWSLRNSAACASASAVWPVRRYN